MRDGANSTPAVGGARWSELDAGRGPSTTDWHMPSSEPHFLNRTGRLALGLGIYFQKFESKYFRSDGVSKFIKIL